MGHYLYTTVHLLYYIMSKENLLGEVDFLVDPIKIKKIFY